jgi:phytoene dehydrogenase-like protein
MGAITQAMARAATGHGVEIETDAPVREVLIEKGAAARRRSRGWTAGARRVGRSQRQPEAPLHRDDSGASA